MFFVVLNKFLRMVFYGVFRYELIDSDDYDDGK